MAINDQVQTDLLELHDNAGRNGWLISDDYRHSHTRLLTTQNKLRIELGDDDYQQYLQKTEQPWQLIVNTVLTDLAAERAGIQTGDQVQSYDGQRVFTFSELQLLTLQGTADELTDITIIRDGQPVQLFIERGPLGIRVQTDDSMAKHPGTGAASRAL